MPKGNLRNRETRCCQAKPLAERIANPPLENDPDKPKCVSLISRTTFLRARSNLQCHHSKQPSFLSLGRDIGQNSGYNYHHSKNPIIPFRRSEPRTPYQIPGHTRHHPRNLRNRKCKMYPPNSPKATIKASTYSRSETHNHAMSTQDMKRDHRGIGSTPDRTEYTLASVQPGVTQACQLLTPSINNTLFPIYT